MLLELPILSLLIWTPILGGLWVIYAGNSRGALSQKLAFAISLFVLLLSFLLYYQFDFSTSAMQFVEWSHWIEVFNIHYHLGVDGISMPLIVLNACMSVLVILAAWDVVEKDLSQYLAVFLIMEGIMNGIFASLDVVMFYVFWEAVLIPMFLVIGIWGGPRRIYATIKFFLYTFLGSVFMLLALLYLYSQSGTFSILELHDVPLSLTTQKWIFVAFLLAFAVKIPMWPVHTWLPDAHVEAPTGGSMILAAIMLKLGGYGFLRFSLPIVPDASMYFSTMMIVLSLIAVVYIGFVALVQEDLKKLIAYSSIAHMGFVTLGCFVIFAIYANAGDLGFSIFALEGAVVQMLSHGFIAGALFFCIGILYERVHSREISDYGGVANSMPCLAAFMMLFAMANAGLPGTSGFVGEFVVILSSYQANFWIAFCAALTLILGAAYTLWMYKRVMFGEVANDTIANLEDVNKREMLILSLLAVAVLFFGLYPAVLFDVMHPTLENLAEHVLQSKLIEE